MESEGQRGRNEWRDLPTTTTTTFLHLPFVKTSGSERQVFHTNRNLPTMTSSNWRNAGLYTYLYTYYKIMLSELWLWRSRQTTSWEMPPQSQNFRSNTLRNLNNPKFVIPPYRHWPKAVYQTLSDVCIYLYTHCFCAFTLKLSHIVL